MMFRLAVLTLAAVLLCIAGPISAQESPTPTPPQPFATLVPDAPIAALADDFPRIDGSTSGWPVLRLIACKVYGVECFWMDSFFDEERQIMPAFGVQPESLFEQITGILPSGTHEAYMRLIVGETDLILVAREPSSDEIDSAEDLGVTLDIQPVALDAFVFLVNVENPRESFTLDEIRGIYTGEIMKWTALGVTKRLSQDAANLIQPYIRDPNSGSQELMIDLVMGDTPMIDAPNMMIPTMMGVINRVGTDPAGLGYSVYYYTVALAPDPAIRHAAIEGVLPTPETIADGSYPLRTEVYIVVQADTPDDSPALVLRDWLLTGDGQALIAESGYVPIMAP
jgi:phosphate transport system substrate-binding protein